MSTSTDVSEIPQWFVLSTFCSVSYYLNPHAIFINFENIYRKVASSSMSRLVAHFQIFRGLMKGKFDAYVL